MEVNHLRYIQKERWLEGYGERGTDSHDFSCLVHNRCQLEGDNTHPLVNADFSFRIPSISGLANVAGLKGFADAVRRDARGRLHASQIRVSMALAPLAPLLRRLAEGAPSQQSHHHIHSRNSSWGGDTPQSILGGAAGGSGERDGYGAGRREEALEDEVKRLRGELTALVSRCSCSRFSPYQHTSIRCSKHILMIRSRSG